MLWLNTHPGWSSFCGGIFFCSHLHTVHLVKVKDQKKRTLDEKKSRLKTSRAYVLVKCAPHKSLSIMKNAFMFQLCLQVHWWYRNRTNVWYISELPLCEFWFFFILGISTKTPRNQKQSAIFQKIFQRLFLKRTELQTDAYCCSSKLNCNFHIAIWQYNILVQGVG